jgi:hypothetical protein
MASTFDLRFIIPVKPLLPDGPLRSLVPYKVEDYTPLDTEGFLPTAALRGYRRAQDLKCKELKKLATRFNSDVIHFVVGFLRDDFENAAPSDVMRKHHVREAVHRLLRSLERDYDVQSVESLMALHLDCEVPHVHVTMARFAHDGALRMRINRLPAALLPLN